VINQVATACSLLVVVLLLGIQPAAAVPFLGREVWRALGGDGLDGGDQPGHRLRTGERMLKATNRGAWWTATRNLGLAAQAGGGLTDPPSKGTDPCCSNLHLGQHSCSPRLFLKLAWRIEQRPEASTTLSPGFSVGIRKVIWARADQGPLAPGWPHSVRACRWRFTCWGTNRGTPDRIRRRMGTVHCCPVIGDLPSWPVNHRRRPPVTEPPSRLSIQEGLYKQAG